MSYCVTRWTHYGRSTLLVRNLALVTILLGQFVMMTCAYVHSSQLNYVTRTTTTTTRIDIPHRSASLQSWKTHSPLLRRLPSPSTLLKLDDTSKTNKNRNGLDESVRTKLVSESIAPWRTLRLFLYFSFGSGALIGGLITLTGFAALLSGAKDGDINTEVRAFNL
jgi:Low psii accumulation1 / Rep27